MKIGVQLYSVRTNLAEDFEGTLKSVSEMGYDGVEFAGLCGKAPTEVRELCEKYNLEPISAHVPFDDLNDNTEKVMADYAAIGCKFIVIPYLQPEQRPGTEGFKIVVDNAERIGKAAKEKGMTLLYHNHDFEFKKIGDEYALDYIYRTVDAEFLQTEVDTCWVNVAGVEPAEYVRKYTGRAPIVHLKDFYKKEGAASGKMYKLIGLDDNEEADDNEAFSFRPLGMGMQDVQSLVDAATDAGAGWVIVEQDEPWNNMSRMDSINASIEHLKTLKF
ncbi:MAG: sugar phosphate isomerase/epimerase [Ruminococcaceae bacterium]|nr:sugar phosphate isomerase/epimerase [Oscillospiraceae bacterium]